PRASPATYRNVPPAASPLPFGNGDPASVDRLDPRFMAHREPDGERTRERSRFRQRQRDTGGTCIRELDADLSDIRRRSWDDRERPGLRASCAEEGIDGVPEFRQTAQEATAARRQPVLSRDPGWSEKEGRG